MSVYRPAQVDEALRVHACRAKDVGQHAQTNLRTDWTAYPPHPLCTEPP